MDRDEGGQSGGRKEGIAAPRIRTASGIFPIRTKERNTISQAASSTANV